MIVNIHNCVQCGAGHSDATQSILVFWFIHLWMAGLFPQYIECQGSSPNERKMVG